jgi:hypothetical protein
MSDMEKWSLRFIAVISLFVAILAAIMAWSSQSHYLKQKQVNRDNQQLFGVISSALEAQGKLNDAMFVSQKTLYRVVKKAMRYENRQLASVPQNYGG